MRPLVSIIIPVYNVEDYLKSCLDSVINQSLNNIEIIVVNDASTDSSKEIIMDYCSKYKEIIFIDKVKNSGLSAARNTGLEVANGEYISFIDSDDWIESDMIEVMYNEAKKANADIALCEMMYEYESYQVYKNITVNKKYLNREQYIKELLTQQHNIESFVMVKIYKRSLLLDNNIKFSEYIKYKEDIDFSIRLSFMVDKVVCIQKPFYHYIQRANSIVHSFKEHYIDDMFVYLQKIEQIIETYSLKKNLYNEFVSLVNREITHMMLFINISDCSKESKILYMDNILNHIFVSKYYKEIIPDYYYSNELKLLSKLISFSKYNACRSYYLINYFMLPLVNIYRKFK